MRSRQVEKQGDAMPSQGDAMFFAGVDIGSNTTKTVITRGDGWVCASNVVPTGASSKKAAERSLAAALSSLSLLRTDLSYVVSTGYGREATDFADTQITEISCHARGIHSVLPQARTVIDIGGQDSKVIRIDAHGDVVAFAMNDKCAAGTGRFLEVMARALEVDIGELGELSRQAERDIQISSMCTVFAESEVISLIAAGCDKKDIIRGLHRAIARRVTGMVGQVGLNQPCAMSGGVARNAGVVQALNEVLGVTLLIPEEPQIIGALGAAILANERYNHVTRDLTRARTEKGG